MINYYKTLSLCIVLFLLIYNLNAQKDLKTTPNLVIKDTFYGKVCEDPYRLMENIKDPNVDKWLHLQSDKTSSYFEKIEGSESLLDEQKNIRGEVPITGQLRITENNFYFYQKKEPNDKLPKLYYRKGFYGKEILLIDPESYKVESKENYIINYFQPCWDGTKIAIGFTKNDEEFSELVVFDVKTKRFNAEITQNCWPSDLGGVTWLKDNSGFFYTHIPVTDKSSEDYILNTASVLYKLGNNPKDKKVVFSKENNPQINIKSADFPIVLYKYSYDNILIGRIGGANKYQDHYYTKLDNKKYSSAWRPLFKKEDKIKQFVINNKEFYFLSGKNSSNYKICKTNLNNLNIENPEIIVEEDTCAVISDFAVTKNGIFYVKNKNGVEAELFQLKNGETQKIDIPKKSGYIKIVSKSPKSNDLCIKIEGWTNEMTRYRYNIATKEFTLEELYPLPTNPELDDTVVEEIEVISHDGVKVPLSIIYKKGIKLNGKNRLLIDGYGAYGFSNTPYLSDFITHWVSKGGVYATAHVRGGGEKGDAWHKGGYKMTKPNTWKDFIACTEHLINKGYTNPDMIAARGGSAGGILIARAITERPDLFKAAIINAGKINMLRSEFGPNGKNNIKEYGTVKDSSEFFALLEMDACQHIKKGTRYPAVLLLAGAHDSRVPIWHSAKFAAGLIAANASNNPVLLSVDYKEGHGLNLTMGQYDQKIANIISFALWQTGHPDFQLKE